MSDTPVKHGTCLLGHLHSDGIVIPINETSEDILRSMFSLGYELRAVCMYGTIVCEYQVDPPPNIHLRLV